MLSVIKRNMVTVIFALFMGIYQCALPWTESIFLDIIGGVEIESPRGEYLQVTQWMFLMGFFVMLTMVRLREKEELYIYEVIRCRSYRMWCYRLYRDVIWYILRKTGSCFLIWYVMDLIVKHKMQFPIIAVSLFVCHLLCCVVLICLIDCVTVRNEWMYVPLVLETGTLLLAGRKEVTQNWFFGTWGMVKRSNYVNEVMGFSLAFVILFEVLIILISCFWSSRNVGGR